MVTQGETLRPVKGFNGIMRRLIGGMLAAGISLLDAQNPAVNPRRVLNAVTLEPAPSRVNPGGLLLIEGINLGPAEGAKASSMPLPTKLADPEVEVLINNRAAPLFSVEPNKILAQVPLETPNGLIQVVVRRGEQRTRPAFVRVQALLPAVKTRSGAGYGEAAGTRDGSSVQFSATGLGLTDPAVASGEPGPGTPRQAIRVFIGGLLADATVQLSGERVGEFDVKAVVPQGASAGDTVTITAGNTAPVNRPTLDRLRAPEVRYTALPAGAQGARVLRAGDLRPSFLVVHGNRGQDGCYPAWTVDTSQGAASAFDGCLIAAAQNAVTPVIIANEQVSLTALVGPPTGTAQEGLSNRVAVFQPGKPAPMIVDTSRAISNLVPLPDGNFGGVTGTQVVLSINSNTGEVGPPPQGGGVGGGGAVPGVGGAGVLLNLQPIDGLNQILFAAGAGGGNQIVIVADDLNEPTRVKAALVNNQGAAQSSVDFPAGWLPLLRAPPPVPPGGVGGGAGPGAVNPAAARRGIGIVATQPNQLVFTVRTGDAHALLTVALPNLDARIIELPAGWFAASCAPTVNFQNFETTRQLVLFGAQSSQAPAANPCAANGFLLVDPAARTVRAIPFPQQGQANLRTQPGGQPDINDYVFAASGGGAQNTPFDTLFVLDALSSTPFSLAPDGLRGFTLQGQAFRADQISSIIATGFRNAAGDGGLVLFDLENGATSVFPVPEGFQSMTLIDLFFYTRKIAALGTKNNASGTEILIYDLESKDLVRVPNPDGVAFVGQLPAQQQQPGGGGGGMPPGGGQGGGGPAQQQPAVFLVPNIKANQIAAMCFNESRQPIGVMTVRIP